MLGEYGYFCARQRDPGELGNRIKQNGNRRFVCHSPVMRDQRFGLVCGFIVVRRLHQRRIIPQLCRPLCALNSFCCPLRTGPGQQRFPFRRLFLYRDKNPVHLRSSEQHGFPGRTQRHIARQIRVVVAVNVLL